MVSTEDGDALGIADFEGDEEGDGLDGEVASIDVVTWNEGWSQRCGREGGDRDGAVEGAVKGQGGDDGL